MNEIQAVDPGGAVSSGDSLSAFDRFRWGCWMAVRAILALTVLLFAGRLLMYVVYGAKVAVSSGDLGRALVTGLRFDLKLGALLSLPLLALSLIPSERWARRTAAFYLAPVLAAVGLTVEGNHYFYGFYSTPLSPMAFGLFEDDTVAILASLWGEYPILRLLVLLAAVVWLQVWWCLRGRPRAARWGLPARAGWSLLVALALGALLRGSFGVFPLRQAHMTVSTVQFVNDLVPNGPMALFYAFKDRAATDLGHNPATGLRRQGYRNAVAAAKALGFPVKTEADVIAQLYPETPENAYAETNRPHVVLAIMEAWGLYPLLYHSAENNLLGRLEPYMARGVLFTNMVSGQNGSFVTLESMLLGSPISPLTQSRYGYRTYASCIAEPFNGKNYRTVFVTSCSGTWRNVKPAFRRQGFKDVLDMTDIRVVFPEAELHTWGVDDEYLFRFAARLLDEADRSGERLLLVLMSGGNHPPYRTPPTHKLLPLRPERVPNCEGATARESLATYQYALDSLGAFLDEIGRRDFAGRTIVAATGDHNHRGITPPSGDAALPLRFGVPLLVLAPPEYLKGRTIDPSRFASHRDLVPTLCHLALSRTRYFASGRNLLAAACTAPEAGPYRHPFRGLTSYRSVVGEGFVIPDLASGAAFVRQPDGRLAAAEGDVKAALQAVVREERAYTGLMDWNIRRQALQDNQAPPAPRR